MQDLRTIAQEIIPSMTPGERRRMHHCRFEHGKDKLYAEMTLDGSMLLMKCHHCGAGGGFRVGHTVASLSKLFKPRPVPEYASYNINLPIDCVPYLEIKSSSTVSEEAAKMMEYWRLPSFFLNQIQYSPSMHRLIIPCFNMEGERTGWQARSLSSKSSWPDVKWLTGGMPGYCKLDSGAGLKSSPVYITEDIPSSMHLAMYTCVSIALLGTSVNTRLLADLINSNLIHENRTIFIWLDNDKPDVVDSAYKAQVTLLETLYPAHIRDVIILNYSEEPKHLSQSELSLRVSEHAAYSRRAKAGTI